MSIAQSLLDIVLEESRKHRLERVKLIRLQVGALAAVVPEALTFCFDLLSQDTLVSGAALEIELLPTTSRCSQCGIVFKVENHVYLCPQCGDPALELVSGRELSVMSIEGETGECDGASQDSCGSKHPSGQ